MEWLMNEHPYSKEMRRDILEGFFTDIFIHPLRMVFLGVE